MTPYGGSATQNGHSVYYNTGEHFNTSETDQDFFFYQGLLHNFSSESGDEMEQRFTIQVLFYFDQNENGIQDLGEHFLGFGSFDIEGVNSFFNSSPDGVTLEVTGGDYKLVLNDVGLEDWLVTTEDVFELSLGPDNPSALVKFGLFKIPDSEIDIKTALGLLRCSAPVSNRICVMNRGSEIEEGTVWLQMDDRFSNFWYGIQPDHFIDSTFVGWDIVSNPGITEVYPYGFVAPQIMDSTQLGELYFSEVNVETMFGTTTEEIVQEYVCAYDPNDKLVVPNREDSLALKDVPLTYTVRFQNTGNFYAEDVLIIDTLSKDLNLNTFRLINSSHPEQLSVIFNEQDNYIVHFKFDNIYLPDSTEDYEGSNGHVMYQISVNENIPDNTVIENTGYIIFDYNPPIITNTTGTTMVDTFPVIISSTEFEKFETPKVYPNPTNGFIFFDQEFDRIEVFDIVGKKVSSFQERDRIELKELEGGIYILKMKIGDTEFVSKIIYNN